MPKPMSDAEIAACLQYADASKDEALAVAARHLAAEVEQLGERLKLAEDVCVMFGWSPSVSHISDRAKATSVLWRRWHAHVGRDYLEPANHPDLDDTVIAALARERDKASERAQAKLNAQMAAPTPALRAAVETALAAEDRSAHQEALLTAYFDATCGDCESGRCHGSGPCGCARHEVSVRWREAPDAG